MSEKVQVVNIHFIGNDLVIKVTETQAERLVAMNNNNDERNKLVKVGKFRIKPSSISYMEETMQERYDLPKYLTERIDKELEVKSAGLIG